MRYPAPSANDHPPEATLRVFTSIPFFKGVSEGTGALFTRYRYALERRLNELMASATVPAASTSYVSLFMRIVAVIYYRIKISYKYCLLPAFPSSNL